MFPTTDESLSTSIPQPVDSPLLDECDERKTPAIRHDRKWPSVLMQLMNSPHMGDTWDPVMERIETHPHEALIQGKRRGMNALHAACVRYPPVPVVEKLLQICPELAMQQNKCLETPLLLASTSSSEEVQEVLIRAVPDATHIADQYGDTPLHLATRQGARYSIMKLLVQTAPETISMRNKQAVTPFWLLPRSFLVVGSLRAVFTETSNEEDDSDMECECDFRNDWNLLVLFLLFSHFDRDEAIARHADLNSNNAPDSELYDWMVYAASSTPACPRVILQFLCNIFPHTALHYDMSGHTPLLCAALASERNDPVAATLSAASSPQSNPPGAIDVLLNWKSEAAALPDSSGRWPLTCAILSGQSWMSIKNLIAEFPHAMDSRDRQTDLPMFLLAAIHSPDLDTVFNIVRTLPEVVTSNGRDGIDDAPREYKRQKRRAAQSGLQAANQ